MKPENIINGNNKTGPYPPLVLRTEHHLLQLLVLGIGVHLLLPQLTTFGNSLQAFRSMSIPIFSLAIMAQILSYIGSGYLVKSCVVIASQTLSVVMGTVITLAASSIGMIAGGTFGNAAATYKWLRNKGVNADGAILAGTLPPLFNISILIITAFLGMIYLLMQHKLSINQEITFIMILFAIGCVVALISWSNTHRQRSIDRIDHINSIWSSFTRKPHDPEKLNNTIQRLFNSVDKMEEGAWKGPARGSCLNIGFDIMTLYLIFAALGQNVSIGVLLAGYGLPLLFGKIVFLIPGGVGVVEGSMAALYSGLGVPSHITVITILMYRMISFWIPTVIGFTLITSLQKNSHNGYENRTKSD